MYDNIYVQTSSDELRTFVCLFSLAMRHTNEGFLQVYGCVYICDYMYIQTGSDEPRTPVCLFSLAMRQKSDDFSHICIIHKHIYRPGVKSREHTSFLRADPCDEVAERDVMFMVSFR